MNRAGMPYSKFQGKYADLSEKILEVFFKVYQELGYGFNEKVYQNALMIALIELSEGN